MTVSNGEGCGAIVPHTGVMLNNMLGEQDLNIDGFHRWAENQRMTSMMAPSLIQTRQRPSGGDRFRRLESHSHGAAAGDHEPDLISTWM